MPNHPVDRTGTLRLITYLSPGLPLELFEDVGAYLEEELGLPATLAADTATSAPPQDELDPFTAGTADVGFLCAPGYCWLSERTPPAVRLVEAAFVFDDPRAEGRPVYFADLVVPDRSPFLRLEDLAGSRWTYNDRASLSGCFSVLEELQKRGLGDPFFGAVTCSGSHRRSLEQVMRGEADCAAIDSNYLLLLRRHDPLLAASVRVIESLGPHAIQPVVARAGLGADLHEALTRSLLEMHRRARWGDLLRRHGVLRFAAVSEADYAGERRALRRCEARIRSSPALAARAP